MASKSKSSKSRRNTASRGFVNNTILECLLDGDKYGYEIIKEVKDKSDGKVVLKEPSLYSSLKRFELKGYITSYWGDSEIGGRRHYYSLTEPGKKYFLSLKSPNASLVDEDEEVESVTDVEQLTLDNINQEIYNIENDLAEVDDSNYINKVQFDVNDKLSALLNDNTPALNETEDIPEDVFNENVEIEQSNAELDLETEKQLINEINTAIQKEQEVIDNIDEVDNTSTENEVLYDHKFRTTNTEISTGNEKYIQYDLFNTTTPTNYVDANELTPKETSSIKEKENVLANNTEREIEKDIPLIKESEVSFFNWNEMKSKASTNKTSFSNKINSNQTTNKYSLYTPTQETEDVATETNNSYKTKNDLHSLFNESKSNNSSKIIDNVTPTKTNNKIFDNVGARINAVDTLFKKSQPEYDDEPQMTEADYELLNKKLNEKFDSITENKSSKVDLDYKKILGDLYYSDNDEISNTNNVENQVYLDNDEMYNDHLIDTDYISTYEEIIDNDIETEKIESAINKSKMYSYNSLNESLANDGFKFKPYSITTSEDDTEHFVKINKVRFIYGAIMSVIMLLQIATIYIILKSSNNLISNDSTLYLVAMLAPITIFIAYLIPYITKKDERKSKYYNLNYHLMFGVLYMFCGLILTYAINLIVGLNHTNTLSFLSKLILPAVLLTNFIISPIVYKLVMDAKNLK